MHRPSAVSDRLICLPSWLGVGVGLGLGLGLGLGWGLGLGLGLALTLTLTRTRTLSNPNLRALAAELLRRGGALRAGEVDQPLS